MRFLVFLAGCTLIVGDRRAPSDFAGLDFAGSDLGGAANDLQRMGGCTTPTVGILNGSTTIPAGETVDIAALGDGNFGFAFSSGNSVSVSTWSTGGVSISDPVPETQNGPSTIGSCAPTCNGVHVTGSQNDSVWMWVSWFDGSNYHLQQMGRSNRTTGSAFSGACPAGQVAFGAAPASTGTNALLLANCAMEMRRLGNTITDGTLTMATDTHGLIGRSHSQAYFGWIQRLMNGHTSFIVQPFDVNTANSGGAFMLPEEPSMANGFNFDVLEGSSPATAMAVYLTTNGAQLSVVTSTGSDKVVGDPILDISANPITVPYGITARESDFVIAYTAADVTPPQVRLQRVGSDGRLRSAPISVSPAGVAAGSPAVAWDRAANRIGVTWVGPMTANSTERFGHFTVLTCD